MRRRARSNNKYEVRRAWSLEHGSRLSRVYEVALGGNDYAGFVGYCPSAREWFAFDSRGNLLHGHGRSREDAARLLK